MMSATPSASFEPAAMQRVLDGEQAAIRARVRRILCQPRFRYEPDASIARQRELAFEWCQALANEGLGALALPKEYGGEDDFAKFMAAFETIATHDISLTIKFTVQFGLWLGSVLLLGTRGQHERYLRQIGTLELPGCFAMTEIGHGSNVRELETTARYDAASEEFVIDSPSFAAGKNYIGNAACHGRMASVFAQLQTRGAWHGVHALLVPIRDDDGRVLPGVRIEDNGPKMGENGVDNARLWFDGVRVPRAALLDRFGGVEADGTYASAIASDGARFFAMISALVGGRISIAAAGLSAAKSGLTIAVRYAARRRQFRLPGAREESALIEYPTHQRRLLPLLAKTYALDFAHKHLVAHRVSAAAGTDTAAEREVERLAAGIKACTTWHTTRVLQECREACGGEGYMNVNRIPGLKADADIFTTFEGDNTVLMVWIGRLLLTEALRAAKGDDAGVASAAAGGSEAAGQHHRWLLRQREERLLAQTVENCQRRIAAGAESAAAAAQEQLALFRLAGAYMERVVLEQFATGIERCAEAGVQGALGRLRDLYAWSVIEQARAWFLENDCLTPAESRTVPKQVDDLCAQLAPDAVALVDAFGIPEECLDSPIGRKL
jgi:acyl-CoA oxidase